MAEKWFGFKGDAARSRVPGQVGQYPLAPFLIFVLGKKTD